MPSLFYRDLFRPYPVTLLLLEHVSLVMEVQNTLPVEEQSTFEQVATEAIAATNSLDRSPTQDDLLYLYERLKTLTEEANKPQDDRADSGDKTFGTNFMDWLDELDSEKLCLFAADFDYQRATFLYTKVDRDAVVDVARLRVESDWQSKLSSFEACLFGFGGSYGDGGDKNTKIIDMTKDPDAATAAIRSMGF